MNQLTPWCYMYIYKFTCTWIHTCASRMYKHCIYLDNSRRKQCDTNRTYKYMYLRILYTLFWSVYTNKMCSDNSRRKWRDINRTYIYVYLWILYVILIRIQNKNVFRQLPTEMARCPSPHSMALFRIPPKTATSASRFACAGVFVCVRVCVEGQTWGFAFLGPPKLGSSASRCVCVSGCVCICREGRGWYVPNGGPT